MQEIYRAWLELFALVSSGGQVIWCKSATGAELEVGTLVYFAGADSVGISTRGGDLSRVPRGVISGGVSKGLYPVQLAGFGWVRVTGTVAMGGLMKLSGTAGVAESLETPLAAGVLSWAVGQRIGAAEGSRVWTALAFELRPWLEMVGA